MQISTIVPTYRRQQDLARCLEALQKQTRLADEVLVVVRDTDTETRTFIESFQPQNLSLQTVTVKVSGVVAAMNAGLEVAQGDIIAFTDDDAAPHTDWLEKIESYFMADESVGGVGGRDWVYRNKQLLDGKRELVGKLQWFGRAIGNHHIGVGKPREVDILKGVNMSFRRAAISGMRFDERMKGTGAQVHFELAFCLELKRKGWKMIYDPTIGVDHYRGQRFDEDLRDRFNAIAFSNAVHNETFVLLEHLSPIGRLAFLLWAVLIGTRKARGLIQLLRFLPSERALAGRKWLASIEGRWQGWMTWRQTQSECLEQFPATSSNLP